MAASATIAPATSCAERPSDTPGMLAALARRSSRPAVGTMLAQVVGAQHPAHDGCPRSTARHRRCGPAAGRSCDVATAMRGSPTRAQPADDLGDGRPRVPAQLRTSSGGGGSPARKSRVSRPAPSGTDTATSGSSSVPDGQLQRAAADVEDAGSGRWTSRTSDARRGRSCGPRPRRRAPAMSSPVSCRTRARTCSPLAASRIADVANAMISVAPMSSASRCPRLTKSTSCSTAAVSTLPSGPRCSDEAQRHLELGRRHRRRAVVGVDEQQVNGVRSEVEHSESHG